MRPFLVAAAWLIAGPAAGADLESGPAPGKAVPSFTPLNVTGPAAGDFACPVRRFGAAPVAAVFARDLTPAVAGLVKKIEAAAVAHRDDRLGGFAVVLSDDPAVEGKLRQLADDERLRHVILARDTQDGPNGYDIDPDAQVTVVLYVRKKVVKTFAFEAGKLDDKAAAKVLAAVREILPPGKPKTRD